MDARRLLVGLLFMVIAGAALVLVLNVAQAPHAEEDDPYLPHPIPPDSVSLEVAQLPNRPIHLAEPYTTHLKKKAPEGYSPLLFDELTDARRWGSPDIQKVYEAQKEWFDGFRADVPLVKLNQGTIRDGFDPIGGRSMERIQWMALVQAIQEAKKGQYQASLDDVEYAFTAQSVLREGCSLVTFGIASYIDQKMSLTVAEILRTTPVPDSYLDGLQAILADHSLRRESTDNLFRCEYQYLYSKRDELKKLDWWVRFNPVMYNESRLHYVYKKWFQFYQQNALKPYNEQEHADFQVQLKEWNKTHTPTFVNAFTHTLLQVGIPRYTINIPLRFNQAKAYRGLLKLQVACLRYARRNGQYPASLELLVPKYLEALPMNPFTGKVYRYSVRDRLLKATMKEVDEKKKDDFVTSTVVWSIQ